jgi:hypothetical protein
MANPYWSTHNAMPGAFGKDAASHHRRQLRVGIGQMPVSPRIVFGKAFGVRKQVPDGDPRESSVG